MAYVDIHGVSHYYEWVTTESWTDRPSDAQKPVFIFLHGWAGSTRYWRKTAQALTHTYDCLLYDLRGFGRSRLPRPLSDSVSGLGYELDSYVDDLVQLLDIMGLDQVYINAHSTGASIAALFVSRHPERVHRAILTCSGIFAYNRWSFSAFHQIGGYVVKFRPRWFLQVPFLDRFFMVRFLKQSIAPTDYREFLEDFLDADPEAALGTIYTAVSEKAALEMPGEFKRLQIPTLLISGQYDQIIPVRLGASAAALNPLIQHTVMPNTGHFPMLEDPEAYLSIVQEFLAQPAQEEALPSSS